MCAASRERRRALVVSHVFPPQVAGGAVRMGQFARLLPQHGWGVTVLTAEHTSAALDRETRDAIASQATIISAPSPVSSVVKRGKPVPRRGFAGLARKVARTAAVSVVFPDREVFWVPGALRVGARQLRTVHHDLVLATYGPASNLLVGHALARAFRLPLVVDFRDLWSTLPMPVFPTPVHRATARSIEHRIVRRASRVLAVAPAMASDLADTHGIEQARAISITNGFDPADVQRVHDARPTTPRPFRLMYCGTVHVHYDLAPLWTALRALADRGEITPETFRIEFVGNLAASDPRQYGLDAFVEIAPYVPHDQVFAALARADALLVVETPGYYARYGYAAKVFDYVLTGKPVVGLVEHGGNTERLLREAGVGRTVEPHDAAGLERVLRDVLTTKGAAPRAMNVDAAPLREFNREHLVATLAEVLDETVTQEPQGRW